MVPCEMLHVSMYTTKCLLVLGTVVLLAGGHFNDAIRYLWLLPMGFVCGGLFFSIILIAAVLKLWDNFSNGASFMDLVTAVGILVKQIPSKNNANLVPKTEKVLEYPNSNNTECTYRIYYPPTESDHWFQTVKMLTSYGLRIEGFIDT